MDDSLSSFREGNLYVEMDWRFLFPSLSKFSLDEAELKGNKNN